jgi:hypothetical protein
MPVINKIPSDFCQYSFSFLSQVSTFESQVPLADDHYPATFCQQSPISNRNHQPRRGTYCGISRSSLRGLEIYSLPVQLQQIDFQQTCQL